ncbi:MAG: type II secretion system GspH family protein [Bryobacteraceae bacterium]|nr:type II secretion system GspH family protein [Bryobacteraceae bacterium]MDW8378899.1 type II secretion system protein [Bryobacterales bacterium]
MKHFAASRRSTIPSQAGFTLLEMLVATTIMAVAVVGLLSALSASLRNAARLTNQDRAALVARRKMEELLVQARLPRYQVLEGPLTPLKDAGLQGGWRARMTPFEFPPNIEPGNSILERVECEIWWMEADRRRSFQLEAYRTTVLTPQDILQGLTPP